LLVLSLLLLLLLPVLLLLLLLLLLILLLLILLLLILLLLLLLLQPRLQLLLGRCEVLRRRRMILLRLERRLPAVDRFGEVAVLVRAERGVVLGPRLLLGGLRTRGHVVQHLARAVVLA